MMVREKLKAADVAHNLLLITSRKRSLYVNDVIKNPFILRSQKSLHVTC